MKNYTKTLLFISMIGVLFMASCINYDFEDAEKQSYTVDFEANTTIDELKAFYGDSLTPIPDSVIIRGTVVANDVTGNYYKAIVLQDSTAGIEIGLNRYELHNLYHIGDLVYIKCAGLYVGDDNGTIKLGGDYQGSVGRIEEPMIQDYMFKSGGGVVIEPELISFNQFNTARINTIVKIENVQFALSDLGGTFADAVNQKDYSRTLETCEGNSEMVRTSGYADFAGNTIPSGNGTFTGILNYYNGDYQLVVREPEELDMEGQRCGAFFSEDFNDGLGSFTSFNLLGDQNTWVQDSHSGTTYAIMSGYYSKAYEESEDWMLSSGFDFSTIDNPVLTFKHAVNYGYYGGWEDDIKVLISTDYDGESEPSSATWTELSFNMPAGDSWNFINSGDIDLSTYGGESSVYIAFEYQSPSNNATTWEVDWIRLSYGN
ncbi:MAG: DUF5689 domain-containing protein [Bacteroidota bacterium]|nr:DUF5689 domain-containing protein [Bacteroidota bacterium]